MSDINLIKAPTAQKIEAQMALVNLEHQKKEQGGPDGLTLAILAILDCVAIGRDTAEIQVQGLKNNANTQESLINQMQQQHGEALQNSQLEKRVAIHKEIVTKDYVWTKTVGYKMEKQTISATVLDQMQWKNEMTSEVRGILQDKLNLEGQNAQIQSGNLNSTTDCVQQSHQELTALLSNIIQLSNQTANM